MLSATANTIIALGKKGVGIFLFIICSVAIYREVGSNENIVQYGAQISIQFKKIAIGQWVILFFLMLILGSIFSKVAENEGFYRRLRVVNKSRF